MAAILGLTDEQVMEICALNSVDAIVSVANFNSPGQAVIAGHTGAVAKVMDDAKTAYARAFNMEYWAFLWDELQAVYLENHHHYKNTNHS